MPTKARFSDHRGVATEPTHSWIDSLSVCKNTGVGLSTNQVYKEDGQRKEEHPFEDISFHKMSNVDANSRLYMVLDGHCGSDVANFAQLRLAADLLLEPQTGKTDSEIREAIKQAFANVERYYFQSVDDKVAQRTSLQYQIPEGLTQYQQYERYPYIVQTLDELNEVLSCGTTAVVALVAGSRLFVANVGCCRALLCKTDHNGVLRVVQLSVDHDLSNEDEILRFYTIGLQLDRTRRPRLGNQESTRCLGNYLVKGGYKHFRELANAREEPITADPEIHPGVTIDDSCRFLLLMSSGLFKTLEEAKGSDQVNIDIARMVEYEFRVQTTLTGVAQAVVDKIVRLHHDRFMSEAEGSGEAGMTANRRDITLLVRNFNQLLPNAPHHGSGSGGTPTRRQPQPPPPLLLGRPEESTTSTYTESVSEVTSPQPVVTRTHVPAYVDFTEFYRNVEISRRRGTLPPWLGKNFDL